MAFTSVIPPSSSRSPRPDRRSLQALLDVSVTSIIDTSLLTLVKGHPYKSFPHNYPPPRGIYSNNSFRSSNFKTLFHHTSSNTSLDPAHQHYPHHLWDRTKSLSSRNPIEKDDGPASRFEWQLRTSWKREDRSTLAGSEVQSPTWNFRA